MIVAWHEVPGTAPPQQSRPVGYGMIRAGVRTDSKIGGGISNAVSVSSIEMIPQCIGGALDHVRHLVTLLLVGSAAPDHTVPYGTVPSGNVFQALRAWLHFVPGYDQPVPPGQSHSPIEGHPIKLALWLLPYVDESEIQAYLTKANNDRLFCLRGSKASTTLQSPRVPSDVRSASGAIGVATS
jgi:hypothetical protein